VDANCWSVGAINAQADENGVLLLVYMEPRRRKCAGRD
jgi:hypothetical protein